MYSEEEIRITYHHLSSETGNKMGMKNRKFITPLDHPFELQSIKPYCLWFR
jgi:hypothetical protein